VLEMGFKTPSGEDAFIRNVPKLPKGLHVSLSFDRDKLISGDSARCVGFSFWRHRDSDAQPTPIVNHLRGATEDELNAYRFMFSCLLRDVDIELTSRNEYRKIVSDEIAGLTGQEPPGPTGRST